MARRTDRCSSEPRGRARTQAVGSPPLLRRERHRSSSSGTTPRPRPRGSQAASTSWSRPRPSGPRMRSPSSSRASRSPIASSDAPADWPIISASSASGTECPWGSASSARSIWSSAILGILKAGGADVPLDPAYPRERLAFLARGLRPVVSREALLGRSRSAAPGCLDALPVASEAIPTRVHAGRPRLRHLHVGLDRSAQGRDDDAPGSATSPRRARRFRPGKGDRVLLSHLSASMPRPGRCHGAGPGPPSVLAEDALAGAARGAARTREGHSPPCRRHSSATADGGATASAELIVAGEAVPMDCGALVARGRRFTNAYGPTEGTVCATADLCEVGSPVTIGGPIDNARPTLCDGWTQPSRGAPRASSTSAASGSPGATSAGPTSLRAVRAEPVRAPGALYRTGDLVRYRADGRIEFLGRIDHQIKLRGFRIEPGEIEAHLLACPGVTEAAVLAADGRLVAWVTGERAGERDGERLRFLLATRLPIHMVPSAIGFVEALPRLPNGKVDRRALAARGLPDQGTQGGFVEPGTEDERRMAAIWAEVLGVPRVGLHDDFLAWAGTRCSPRGSWLGCGGTSRSSCRCAPSSRLRRWRASSTPCARRGPPLLRTCPGSPRSPAPPPTSVALGARAEGRLVTVGTLNPKADPLGPDDGVFVFPASHAQKRLWFLDQLAPGSPVYNLPFAWRLRGPLDPVALDWVLSEIVARHEPLRDDLRPGRGGAGPGGRAARLLGLLPDAGGPLGPAGGAAGNRGAPAGPGGSPAAVRPGERTPLPRLPSSGSTTRTIPSSRCSRTTANSGR